MGISPDQLHPAPIPLKGFTCNVVQSMVVITLSVLAGKASRTVVTMADFLVVKASSSYNTIQGCPTMNSLRAITSTYHLKMRFPTDLGVGEVRSEKVLAWECYTRELRHKVKVVTSVGRVAEATQPPLPPNLDEWDEEVCDKEAMRQAKPKEPLELISVDSQRLEQTVRVGMKLNP